MDNPFRYEDPRYEGKIGSITSQESANQLRSIQKTDPYRAKFLSKLVTSNVLQLGGRKRKSSNKNKKLSRRRHGKKGRKSVKRN